MPPRPFPFALGVGTDIVHTSRIAKLVGASNPSETSSKLQPFLNRFLTGREQRDFRDRFASQEELTVREDSQTARYLAGRWAAKEAVIKAVHPRRLMLTEIEILKYPSDDRQKGVFALIRDEWKTSSVSSQNTVPSSADASPIDEDTAASSVEGSFEDLEGQIAKVSISHDGEYATAVCLAANMTATGDVGGEAAARMP